MGRSPSASQRASTAPHRASVYFIIICRRTICRPRGNCWWEVRLGRNDVAALLIGARYWLGRVIADFHDPVLAVDVDDRGLQATRRGIVEQAVADDDYQVSLVDQASSGAVDADDPA